MSILKPGQLQINAVIVNDQTVMNNEGFLRMEISPTELKIDPIGFRFRIQQSTSRSAVLEASGRVFFVDFVIEDNEIQLKMSRPEMTETISISAEYVEVPSPSYV